MTREWKRKDRRDELRMRTTTQGGSVVAVGVIFLLIGLLGGAMLARTNPPPAVATTGTAHVYLNVAYNPYTGLDEYFPANFTVPTNVPIIITITNYDNGTNTVPSDYAKIGRAHV